MAERYDPYHDWIVGAGRENFKRLFRAEVHTMADNHSKDANYRNFRRHAVQFIENLYTVDDEFDALIPYMAMTLVDRFHLDGYQIPIVAVVIGHNIDLFPICCLTISWKLRTERFNLENFLKEKQLSHFSVEHVIEMESRICRKLDWHLLTVMPFKFIDFFTPFLNLRPNPSSALRPVYQLIVKAQSDIAFTEFRPSVIAASAMLIVTKNEFPSEVNAFENDVMKSEFLKLVQGMITRCSTMLEKLYKGPSTASRDPAPADRGGASSSAATRRCNPMPIIPWPTDGQGKELAISVDEDPTHHEGMRPASVDEEQTPREGKVPIHREGKQDASEDEDKEATAGDNPKKETDMWFSCYFQDKGYTDDLMNFKLDWIEAQAPAHITQRGEIKNYFERKSKIRRAALLFIQLHYTPFEFDALIPYQAMTLVDCFNCDQIPTVVEDSNRNLILFVTSCLMYAWKVRSRLFILENMLNQYFRDVSLTADNVEVMESHIIRHLDGQMPVMPFSFIHSFSGFHTLGFAESYSTLRPTYQLVVKSQFDEAFTEFSPSIIAASAILIVTSNMFPNEVDSFTNNLLNCEVLAPVQDRVLCYMKLLPLYTAPSTASRDADSSSSCLPQTASRDPTSSSSLLQQVATSGWNMINRIWSLCYGRADEPSRQGA